MDVFSGIVMEDNTRQCAEITNHWTSAAFNQNKAIGSDQLHGQTLCQLCSTTTGVRLQVLHQLQ